MLDVIITDLWRYYQEPKIIPAIPVDPGCQGVPSDHSGVQLKPLDNSQTENNSSGKIVKTIRPMPESLIVEFGKMFVHETWSCLKDGMDVDMLTNTFETHMNHLINIHFPTKQISISPFDKPYITENLKHLRRRCQRIYQKQGRSEAYLRLKCEFKEKLQVEALKYKNKIINEVKQGKRGSAFSLIRRLGDGPNDDSKYRVFTLPHFVDNNYSDEECAESLANHFARISQTLPPININDFPPNLINTLKNVPYDKKPVLSDFQVYQKLSKAKKPNSYVTGDIPKPILKEFLPEISSPVTIIFNKITQSSSYPRSWVIE